MYLVNIDVDFMTKSLNIYMFSGLLEQGKSPKPYSGTLRRKDYSKADSDYDNQTPGVKLLSKIFWLVICMT